MFFLNEIFTLLFFYNFINEKKKYFINHLLIINHCSIN
jgi:hypothetical protein